MVVLIILSCLFWIASLAAAFKKIILSPAFAFIGLLLISFAKKDGFPILPINATILWGWLAMSAIVMVVTLLQPSQMNRSSLGIPYILGGALAGMAVGLLGYTFSSNISLLYGIMVVATAVGVFLGFLFFSRTPAGKGFAPGGGLFLKYLTAKGFPVAISVMQIGVVLVITIALHNIASL